jgi:antitoxin ParD1/3/4
MFRMHGEQSQRTRDRATEHWLRDRVAPAYDALKASPDRTLKPKTVRAALGKAHKAAKRREKQRGSG